ncbi:MAG: DUF819 family protein [Rhodothermales bacterium]|nr:DUF819 family protein [Rhodothermales bacterium]
MQDPVFVAAALCVFVAVSEWLVRKTVARHLGTALLVILVTAVAANVGLIPAGSSAEAPVPVYDGIFAYLAPLAIFLLLLPVNLRDVLKAGKSMIVLFLLGSVGVAGGIIIGMWVIDGATSIGPEFRVLAGMFTGTYTGGSVNFNTIALEYDVVRDGVLYAGSIVVDNIVTTIWMVVTLALPRVLYRFWPARPAAVNAESEGPTLGIEIDTEELHPIDLGILLGLGFFCIFVSDQLAAVFPAIPSAIFLTALALILGQISWVQRLRGMRTIGMFAVYLFLAVIGAFCDLAALSELGSLGMALLGFTTIAVLIHGLITFLAAYVFRVDPDIAAVASQANVGGGTSALAVARSLGREDLVLPGILVGSLGYAVGTFLGFAVVEFGLNFL